MESKGKTYPAQNSCSTAAALSASYTETMKPVSVLTYNWRNVAYRTPLATSGPYPAISSG